MKRFLLLLALLAILTLNQCSDNPVDEKPNPPTTPTSTLFEDLADELAEIGDIENVQELKDFDFSGLRTGFENNLQSKPDDPISHLGLAILEIVELNYNENVWDIVDSLEAWDEGFDASMRRNRHNTLIGREFSLLAEVPFSMGLRMATQFPGNVTVHDIQDIIENDVLTALDRAIAHLNVVEAHPSASVRFRVQDNGVWEYVVIDMGEILLFSASVHALHAAFNMMIAYDVDMYGPDGTYGWIDQMRALEHHDEWYCYDAEVIVQPGSDDIIFTLRDGPEDEMRDSILVVVGHHNLENRSSFLTLRDMGASLAQAQTDITTVLDKLNASATFIRNRTGETEENVIKLADLEDLDSGLGDPAGPRFADHFNTVEDVFAFVDSLFTGPKSFTEELGKHGELYSWTMDLSKFFTDPITDWKTLLPYHQWNLPAGPWITDEVTLNWSYDNGGWYWWEYVWNGDYCDWVDYNDIGWVWYYSHKYNLVMGDDFLQFLDGPGGNVIDMNVVRIPYMPDYTLHGIFPYMTRQDWLDLEAIVNP